MKMSPKRSIATASLLTASLLLSACGSTAAPAPSASAAPTPAPAPSAVVEAGPLTYADTVSWDGAYDVVVVGFGGAGAVAAKTAADEGANVLLLEKAPEGHEGGNTRYCGQFFVYGNGNYEATLAYYKALQGNRNYSEAMLEVYASGIANLTDILANDFGADPAGFTDWSSSPFIKPISPEYPELPGSETLDLWTMLPSSSDGHFWQFLRKNVTDRADKIDVWFESPAVHLIQDPVSKAVIGVQVERGGEMLNIRAQNGVVLSCGGFENNPSMLEDYLGLPTAVPVGTLYNTGDGILMSMEVGADLWHMDVYEGDGTGYYGGVSLPVPEGSRAIPFRGSVLASGSLVFLAADGSRYLREDEVSRHGHVYQGGTWDNPKRPVRSFLLLDQPQYDIFTQPDPIYMSTPIPADYQDKVVKADTLAELAGLTGMDPDILAATVKNYNTYAKQGYDPELGRSAESMVPLTENGPYYALELLPAVLNTQGGPRRNENSEVLGMDGNPIPHLYSAGELGGVTAFQYQGGGNMAECVIFGQIAGRNAAAEKAPLPNYELPTRVESNLVHTPGVTTDLVAGFDDSGFAANEYLGESNSAMGGSLYVKVTMDGDSISAVEVVQQNETVGIGDKAVEALPGAIVAANSTEVDTIAGATITSKAIIEAVNDALSKVK